MQTILLTDIIIPPERQRREFDEDAIIELRTSIKTVGLLQPVVLRDDGKTLVCGERRLKAIGGLEEDYFYNGSRSDRRSAPYVRVSDLSREQLYQAELEENLCRRDLSWQEKAIALKKFHQLRSGQAASRGETQTVQATASEVLGRRAQGRQIQEVNNAILLSEYLDDPEVAAQKTVADALKVVRDSKKHRDRKLLAASFDPTKTPHLLHVADSYLDAPKRYPGFFDVVLTDPPYGIDAHKKDTFDVSQHLYDDSEVAFARVRDELPAVIRSITKPDSHAYIFCDIRRFEGLYVAFELAGFTVWHKPIIWDKGNTGSYGNIDYGPRACYDAILYARRGNKKVVDVRRDVINIPQPTNLSHPAGKPPALYEDLLKRSCFPGERVADLFAGSGPIYPAASALKVQAVGWENHEVYAPMAQESLSKTMGK